jgi:hypothetical protein
MPSHTNYNFIQRLKILSEAQKTHLTWEIVPLPSWDKRNEYKTENITNIKCLK